MKALEQSDRTLVHQVWSGLLDGTLVAVLPSFWDGEVLARGLIREARSPQATYVVSGGYEGQLQHWTPERLAKWDEKKAKGL